MVERGHILIPLLVVASLAMAAPVRAQGGPDAFGYTWTPTPFSWVDPGQGGVDVGISVDDQEVEIALPWSFFFYGVPYDHITISDNGAIRMSDGSGALEISYSNSTLPSTGANDPDIAAFWDDLNISGGGTVYTQVDIPSDRFVISWVGLPHFSDFAM